MKKRTIEEYVEVVYNIQSKKKKVHTNSVASELNVSPASVTEMFQKLNDERYIDYKKYSGVSLTKKGEKIAIATKRKHDTLKNFLMILGVDENIADEDACRIEHNINPETMKKLRKFVEFASLEDVCTKWLEHFRYYIKTGKYIECKLGNSGECSLSNVK